MQFQTALLSPVSCLVSMRSSHIFSTLINLVTKMSPISVTDFQHFNRLLLSDDSYSVPTTYPTLCYQRSWIWSVAPRIWRFCNLVRTNPRISLARNGTKSNQQGFLGFLNAYDANDASDLVDAIATPCKQYTRIFTKKMSE